MQPVVLIVEDNKANRQMLTLRLSMEGYQTVAAESGYEALALLKQQAVDVILLDLMMPVVSGLEVLEEVRKEWGPRQLPVLMISAVGEGAQIAQAIDAGANDYLTKPLDFHVLLAKIRFHLQLSSSGRTALRPLAGGEALDHYRLIELIGKGGMGQVFRAQDTRLQREVALKILSDDHLSDESRQRFRQEAQAVARVSHPGVVAIYDVGFQERFYIAMELLQGELLRDALSPGPFPWKRAAAFMMQVLEALVVVHEAGVTHRDLNPSNLMLTAGERIKVMDFGLAKLSDQTTTVTRAGEVWGTPQYMAPEQIDPRFGPIDAQTDLFALSCVFYEMVSGRTPFQAPSVPGLIYQILSQEALSPVELAPELPEALCDVILKGLRKEKALRFYDGRAYLAGLQQALLSCA